MDHWFKYIFGEKMKLIDFEEGRISVTFSEGSVKVTCAETPHLIKWFKSDQFIGQMDLAAHTWGAYPIGEEIDDWVIEIWSQDGFELLFKHYHLLHGSNVLIIPKLSGRVGKYPIDKLITYAKRIQERGAKTWVFFEGSHYFDLESHNLHPLRMNQEEIDFQFIIETDL